MENVETNVFTTNDNILLLWEIITDDERIKKDIQGQDNLLQFRKYYHSKIKHFGSVSDESDHNDVMNMNKKFINTFMTDLYQNNSEKQTYKLDLSNMKPLEGNTEQLITIEELHNDRISSFEKDLQLKKTEFDRLNQTPVPTTPNFKEQGDEPIKENMQELIAKAIAERQLVDNTIINSDIENNVNNQNNIERKNEKHNVNKKEISWGNNTEYDLNIDVDKDTKITNINTNTTTSTNIESSIFSRLKTVHSDNNLLHEKNTTLHNTTPDGLKEQLSEINQKLDYIITKLFPEDS